MRSGGDCRWSCSPHALRADQPHIAREIAISWPVFGLAATGEQGRIVPEAKTMRPSHAPLVKGATSSVAPRHWLSNPEHPVGVQSTREKGAPRLEMRPNILERYYLMLDGWMLHKRCLAARA
jgi:hypothetical protein